MYIWRREDVRSEGKSTEELALNGNVNFIGLLLSLGFLLTGKREEIEIVLVLRAVMVENSVPRERNFRWIRAVVVWDGKLLKLEC